MMRHLSFDVWNTLIKSNLDFSAARRRFLAAELSLPAERVQEVYIELKTELDFRAEAEGFGMSSAQVYDEYMKRLGRPEFNWWNLRRGIELQFAKHPPIVLKETIEQLRIAQDVGLGLSIGSNTNFVQGTCLNDVALGTWGIAWDFQTFSDQIAASKPHPHFWNVVKARAEAHTGAEPFEILHIGDNKVCDGGCEDFGIPFKYVSGPDEVPAVLEEVIRDATAHRIRRAHVR